jgi:hypothetical protein
MTSREDSAPAAHHARPYRRLVLADDLVTDQAVADASGDQFHHAAIAKAVGDLALSSAAPVNIALFGPWGSGKSSFYYLMRDRIRQQDPQVAVARYDAWKYGGSDLKRHFIQNVAEQLGLKFSSDLDRDLTLNQEQSRLRLRRWFRYNWASILGAFIVGFIFAAAWAVVHAAVFARWVEPEKNLKEVLPAHFGEFGLVFAAILTALLLGPKALESAVVKTTRPAIDRDDQFAHTFSKLVDRVKAQRHAHRLVVFIDELDRCQPDDVVSTLVDLKTFLEERDCVFVVAADREVLEHALRRVPQAKPIRDEDPYYSTPGAFIDKIFQHQISLPPLRAHALSSFAHGLVGARPRGLWKSLQDVDPSGRLFDDVVYILVPAHVSSPRRVKVVLNNFATNMRISESRHINWLERAREIAFLTVLETEFPPVAAAMIHFPQLLGHLRGEGFPVNVSSARKDLVERFTYDPASTNTGDSVSGTIVREDGDLLEDAKSARAKVELARQLSEYLDKLTVIGGLNDPRPDLFYLRGVGYDHGLTDSFLGEMIDLAAERQPAVVVDAFREQSQDMKGVAVSLLVATLATERGTGQANVLEAACRIVQELDKEQVDSVAHLAPEVLTHIGRTSWRDNAIPGAIILATAQEQGAEQVARLVGLLAPTDTTQSGLLTQALPALDWADDETAAHIHEQIRATLPTTSAPLVAMLGTTRGGSALRGWKAVSGAVTRHYKAAAASDRIALFDDLTSTVAAREDDVDGLLFRIMLDVQNANIPDLIAHIHQQRETLLAALDDVDRVRASLYQIERGAPADWPDWLAYLPTSQQSQQDIEAISEYARDAVKVVLKAVPSATDDYRPLLHAIAPLVSPQEVDAVIETVVETLSQIPWGDPVDPEHMRRTSLDSFMERLATTAEERAQYEDALRDAIQTSVTAHIPTLTPGVATPGTKFADWRHAIGELPAERARTLDQGFGKLTPPTSVSAHTEFLRLRIAARYAFGGAALGPNLILPVANDPAASSMATEWLELVPRASAVAKVHDKIPIGTKALSRYAARIEAPARTELWIAIESQGGSAQHLRAVGQHGVTGAAIQHMAPKILEPPRQSQRDASMSRLLLARFTKEPSRAETANGQAVGHREATDLALALVDKGGFDNIALAGGLIIHSGGVGHGAKGKLHRAFTGLANGRQSRNFTRAQASALNELGLLTPRKRGRMSWLFDLAGLAGG